MGMSKQTEALKLALEALEKIGLRGWVERKEEAITAIREALAHAPTEREQPAQQRIDYRAECWPESPHYKPNKQQEPVAYRHLHEDGWEYYDAPTGDDCEGCQPLYTRPQPAAQWVGLTDEHRREVINAAWNGYLRGEGNDSFSWHLTQVIEAKLREKNT